MEFPEEKTCVVCGCRIIERLEAENAKLRDRVRELEKEKFILGEEVSMVTEDRAVVLGRLREAKNQLRWRKYPDELPDEWDFYWAMREDPLNPNDKLYPCVFEGWEILDHQNVELFFRPIGELPNKEKGQ